MKDRQSLIELWWVSWHTSSSFEHPKPLSEWERRWDEISRTHEVQVAIIENDLVGFVAIDEARSILTQLFVSPRHKRKGIGTVLFRWANENCKSTMHLKTLTENTESRRFYEAQGMCACGSSKNEFSGKPVVEYAL